MADHILNDGAELAIKSDGIISMYSGDEVRASTDIDLIFLTPIHPFVILVEFFHLLTISMACATSFS